MAKTGRLGVNFLASETGAGKYILRVTRLNGECSQNLVSNPARVLLRCRVDDRQQCFEFLSVILNTTTSFFVTAPWMVNVL